MAVEDHPGHKAWYAAHEQYVAAAEAYWLAVRTKPGLSKLELDELRAALQLATSDLAVKASPENLDPDWVDPQYKAGV